MAWINQRPVFPISKAENHLRQEQISLGLFNNKYYELHAYSMDKYDTLHTAWTNMLYYHRNISIKIIFI